MHQQLVVLADEKSNNLSSYIPIQTYTMLHPRPLHYFLLYRDWEGAKKKVEQHLKQPAFDAVNVLYKGTERIEARKEVHSTGFQCVILRGLHVISVEPNRTGQFKGPDASGYGHRPGPLRRCCRAGRFEAAQSSYGD